MSGIDPLAPPSSLADTGCFSSMSPLTPAPGLIPYAINAPLFSDEASKQRWIVATGEPYALEDGRLDFDVGTVLLKHFEVMGTPVETRVMIRASMDWAFHTYVWDGTQATLIPDGAKIDVGFEWSVPTLGACRHCHGAIARVLGPELGQLDVDVCYDGGAARSQLEALAEWGALSSPESTVPALVDPTDSTAPLEDRARSYLHVNCASCHQPGGWTPPNMTMDLRYGIPLTEAAICGVPIQFMGDIANTELRLDPGNPWESHLYIRMRGGGLGKMPQFGAFVDPTGTALIGAWIHEMSGCN